MGCICCGPNDPCVHEYLIEPTTGSASQNITGAATLALFDGEGVEDFHYHLVTKIAAVDHWDTVEAIKDLAIGHANAIVAESIDWSAISARVSNEADDLEAADTGGEWVALIDQLRTAASDLSSVSGDYNSAKTIVDTFPYQGSRIGLAFDDEVDKIFASAPSRQTRVINKPGAAEYESNFSAIRDNLKSAKSLFPAIGNNADRIVGIEAANENSGEELLEVAREMIADALAASQAIANAETLIAGLAGLAAPTTASIKWHGVAVEDRESKAFVLDSDPHNVSTLIKSNNVPRVNTSHDGSRTFDVYQKVYSLTYAEGEETHDLEIAEVRVGDPGFGNTYSHRCDSVPEGTAEVESTKPTVSVTLPVGDVEEFTVESYRTKNTPECFPASVDHPVPFSHHRWRYSWDASTVGIPTGVLKETTTTSASMGGNPNGQFPEACWLAEWETSATYTAKDITEGPATDKRWHYGGSVIWGTAAAHVNPLGTGVQIDGVYILHPVESWPMNESYWWSALETVSPYVVIENYFADGAPPIPTVEQFGEVVSNTPRPSDGVYFFPGPPGPGATSVATHPVNYPGGVPNGLILNSSNYKGGGGFQDPNSDAPLPNFVSTYHHKDAADVVYDGVGTEPFTVDGTEYAAVESVDGVGLKSGWQITMSQQGRSTDNTHESLFPNPDCPGPSWIRWINEYAGFSIVATFSVNWTQSNQITPVA